MNGAPWLSVLMPTYNGAAYVASALESICAGETRGIEVIVADDGSTDATLEIVRSFEARLALRVVSRDRVGNWVRGANLALRAAVGRYTCVLHQDDVWMPGRSESVRAAVAMEPRCALLVHPAVYIGPRGAPLGLWRTPFGRADTVVPATAFVARLLVQNFLAMPSPLFDREAAMAQGLDESLWYTADWDLWLRLAALGPVRVLSQPLTGFRLHPHSQTISRPRTSDEFRAQLRTVVDRHFPAWAATADPRLAARVRRVADFSIEVNVALAAAHRGEGGAIAALTWAFLRLGPAGWRRYLRDSRVRERVAARLHLR